MATEEQPHTEVRSDSQDTLKANKDRKSLLKYVFVKKKHRDSKKDDVAIEKISNEIANWVKNRMKQEQLNEEESVESMYEDENDYFFRSMALITKRLSKEDQAKIRLELCKLITDAETKSHALIERIDVKNMTPQPVTAEPESKNLSEQFQEVKQGKNDTEELKKEKVGRQKGKLEEESHKTVNTDEVIDTVEGSAKTSLTSSEGQMESTYEHKATQIKPLHK